jgi:lipopolysaccharide transport system permease protein
MTTDTNTALLSSDGCRTSQGAYPAPSVLIEPSGKFFRLDLKDLWEYRELLYFLAWRDLKARYAQTLIGVGWAIVQPLCTMAILTLVFSKWAKIPSDGVPYPIFAYAALLPWTYFARSFDRSGVSIAAEGGLISKVYFPRLIIPIAATIGGLLDFALGLILLLAMMVWYGIAPTWGVLALPGFLLMTLATALAISLWFSALHVQYRDVGAIIPLVIQIWMFASPVAYPISLVPEQWRMLYSLNPMVGVIEGFRWALLGSASPNVLAMVISMAVILVLMFGGLLFFKRMERNFTDVI